MNTDKLKQLWRDKQALIVVIGSALILTVFLFVVNAASPFSAFEAEGANLSGNAFIKSASGTSGGSYVEFSGGTSPSPPPSTKTPSGPISISNQSNVVIEGKSFKDLGSNVIAIRLENVKGVTIRNNDFRRVAEAIYIVNSTGPIIIENNYAEDILGPHTRDGSNRANFVQLNNVWGKMSIANNIIDGGDFEDVISLYKSGGNDSSNLLHVHHNKIRGCRPGGLCWVSRSGSGVMSGDAGGSYALIEKNVMVNPGQVGVGIASGTHITVRNNLIYQEKTSNSNVGIYVWNQYPNACSNHVISNNRVNYINKGGSSNGFWNGGNCSSVSVTGNNWNDSSITSAIWDKTFAELGL